MFYKDDFVSRFAKKGYRKSDAQVITKDFIETLGEMIVEGKDSIRFVGFGTFSIADRAERTGYKFSTKEKITIPAHKVLKFVPAPIIKEKLNGKR